MTVLCLKREELIAGRLYVGASVIIDFNGACAVGS